jgi:hypothetical protein
MGSRSCNRAPEGSSRGGERMTAISFDPLAIYYIIALIAIPILGLLYTTLTENFYWKGFKDGKRLAENNRSARHSERS